MMNIKNMADVLSGPGWVGVRTLSLTADPCLCLLNIPLKSPSRHLREKKPVSESQAGFVHPIM